MKNIFLIFCLFIGCIQASAQFSIGHRTITFNDPLRTGGFGSGGGSGRQIQSEIYYPATSTGNNTPVAAGAFPVVVFGHGFVMTWDAYQNIWEELVPKGYILVFPRTEGGFSPVHNDFALDLNVCIDKMQALNLDLSSPFYNHIENKSALMGHSMGGGASILAAANNTTIETVVALAPAETTPSAITAAAQVTVPALIFSGSADGVTPPATHHVPIYNAISSTCKYFISITGGAHCYFANANFNCDFGESVSSTGITISRTQQHAILFEYLEPWLKYKLKNNCTAYNLFTTTLNSDTDVTSQQNCNLPPLVIAAAGPTTICEGNSVTINSASSLNWSTGSIGNSITVSNAGNYFGTDANCQTSNIITVNISLIDSVVQVLALCNGQTYTIGTNTYSVNGSYFDVFTNSNNCDSVVNTQLTFSNSVQGIDIQNACGPITWIDGNTYSTNNSTATFTLTGGSAFGCDSVVTLNLTINSVDVNVINNGSQISATASSATFNWLDCNSAFTPVGGQTSSIFTPTVNGNYAVEVTQNGCKDTSTCYLFSSVGVEDWYFENVLIYPNPTEGILYIRTGDLKSVEVKIYSLLGELVFQTISNQFESTSIELNSSSGVYILELFSNGNRKQFKIIKN